jgi:hypothetical protein
MAETSSYSLSLPRFWIRSFVLSFPWWAKLDLPARYRMALRLVRRLERDVPGFLSRLPAECPYELEQIISSSDEDWFPEPKTNRHSGART